MSKSPGEPPYSTDKGVELLPAVSWICNRCGVRNFVSVAMRARPLEPGESAQFAIEQAGQPMVNDLIIPELVCCGGCQLTSEVASSLFLS